VDHLFSIPHTHMRSLPAMSDQPEVLLLGERLVMLAERALHWPGADTLFVADPAFGRAAAFHKTRTVVESTRADLDRLSAIIAHVEARRVIFLGELLHPRAGRAAENLEAISIWREELAAVEMAIVSSKPLDLPEEWAIAMLDELHVDAPFMLANRMIAPAMGYALVGAQHPGASLVKTTKMRGALLPCFWFGMHTGALPAFGATSGLMPIKPEKRDRVFITSTDRVVQV
jgi:uncharacterized protein